MIFYHPKTRFFCYLTLFLCLFPLSPFSSSASQEIIPAQRVKRITVKNFNGKVEFKHSKGSYKFNLTGNIFLKNRNGNVEIKGSWPEDNSNTNTSKATLTVSGPSAPLYLFIKRGSVTLTKWKRALFLSAQDAQVVGKDNEGAWSLTLNKGKLNLKNHKGAVRFKGFNSVLSLENIKGDLDFQFNEGSLRAKEIISSSSYFSTHTGSVNIRNFEGKLKGFSQEGKIYLSYFKSKDINIETQAGPIYIISPKRSIKISAYSEKGKVFVPKHFYKKLSGRSQTAKGWLAGSSGRAKALLKTDTGNIYIQ